MYFSPGEGEFNQRMERFKTPVLQASPTPTPDPAGSCPRSLSNFVSGIQQKLQGDVTPSSKQASRIRQVSWSAQVWECISGVLDARIRISTTSQLKLKSLSCVKKTALLKFRHLWHK